MSFESLPALYAHDISELCPLEGVALNLLTIGDARALGSGNKQYKLYFNLRYIKAQGYQTVVSFGGAYSNHIGALADACHEAGLSSVGIIRGEAHYAENETLSKAQKVGMQLQFVDRKTYRQRHELAYLQSLEAMYPNAFMLPEGGSNSFAVEGCERLAQQINSLLPDTTVLCSACGTGGTVAGLVRGARQDQQVLGFSVLNDAELGPRVAKFIARPAANYALYNAAFGGYAKIDLAHLQFIEDWYDKTGILLDPIYTSKMCRALLSSIPEQGFSADDCITMIHTGGLQGWWGMQKNLKQLGKQALWHDIITPYLLGN